MGRGCLMSCLNSSWPKTGRESTSCCVPNPRQVFNLAVVRALPEADFAGFPTDFGVSASTLDHAFLARSICPTNYWDRTLAADRMSATAAAAAPTYC